jgi:hypothetical protein
MAGSKASKPRVKMVSTGSAKDLLGSVSTALMIPVALFPGIFLGRYLGSAVG